MSLCSPEVICRCCGKPFLRRWSPNPNLCQVCVSIDFSAGAEAHGKDAGGKAPMEFCPPNSDLKKPITIICVLLACYFTLVPNSSRGDPPPFPTNGPCTNCSTNVIFGNPTSVSRYGYTIGMQWANPTQSVVTNITWSTNGFPTLCSMVPTSHVAIVVDGVPIQQDNTNSFAHEPSIYSNGTNVVVIFWAPNAFSFKRGLRFGGLIGNWIEIPGNAPTNFSKNPNAPDPWWPVTFSGQVGSGNNFFKLRRMDSGLGWTNVCGL